MRTGQPIIGRPAWYDRNPTAQESAYAGDGVAPHDNTNRWTYTCPTGKKAMAEFMLVSATRKTAASAAGLVSCYINYMKSGTTEILLMEGRLYKNSVGDQAVAWAPQNIILLPGDKLLCYTIDLSTGGTVDYRSALKVTEFDA